MRKLYDRKAGEMGTSQAQIAEEFGFANASAVSQYLCGRIPLNLNAATKFANFFNVPLRTISPRHAETVVTPTEQGSILAALGVTPDCEVIPATDQARKVLGDFDHLVVDRSVKSLSAGTFLAGGGADGRVIIVSMEGEIFCVKGLGEEGSEVRLPPAAAPLINVDGRVVLMTRKL